MLGDGAAKRKKKRVSPEKLNKDMELKTTLLQLPLDKQDFNPLPQTFEQKSKYRLLQPQQGWACWGKNNVMYDFCPTHGAKHLVNAQTLHTHTLSLSSFSWSLTLKSAQILLATGETWAIPELDCSEVLFNPSEAVMGEMFF